MTGTNIQLVRARVPVQLIDALENPSQILKGPIVIEKSEPLDMLDEKDRARLFIALACVLDEYFQNIRPTLTHYQKSDFENQTAAPRARRRRPKKSR